MVLIGSHMETSRGSWREASIEDASPCFFHINYPLRQAYVRAGADPEVFLLGSLLGLSPWHVVGSGQPVHLGQNIV